MKSVSLALALTIVAACAAGTGPDNPSGSKPAASRASGSAASLAEALRGGGLAVEDAGMVEQPFFPVPAHVYRVEESDLQVYEFATPAEAERAASQVAPSGSPIGTSMVTWMAPPHFFRKDRLVVNFIGSSERVLGELQRLLGPQFAGQ